MADGPAGGSSPESASRSSRADGWLQAWVFPLLLGLAGAIFAGRLRLPVQLPGHAGFVLVLVLLVGRVGSRQKRGGTTTATMAALGGFLLGHDPIGSLGLLPAGMLVDGLMAPAGGALSRALRLILAGALGNAVVLVLKLLVGDLPRAVLTRGLAFALLTYLAFGLAAGLVAAVTTLVADG